MAGNDQRDWVAGQGAADRASGAGVADARGQAAVGGRLARGDPAASEQDLAVKGAQAVKADHRISTEIDGFAFKIGDDTLPEVWQEALVRLHGLDRQIQGSEYLAPGGPPVWEGQAQPMQNAITAGDCDVTPACLEGCVLHSPVPRYGRRPNAAAYFLSDLLYAAVGGQSTPSKAASAGKREIPRFYCLQGPSGQTGPKCCPPYVEIR